MTDGAIEQAVAPRGYGRLAPWVRLWRAPSLIVARQIVRSHLRSGWLWGELIAVLSLYVVFFDYPGT
ncbi:MAG: hypothetical protein ACRDHE_14020, partial [Ktedonobacterales bacterium]